MMPFGETVLSVTLNAPEIVPSTNNRCNRSPDRNEFWCGGGLTMARETITQKTQHLPIL